MSSKLIQQYPRPNMGISELHLYAVGHQPLVGDTFTFRASHGASNPFSPPPGQRARPQHQGKRARRCSLDVPRKRPRQQPQPVAQIPKDQPLITSVIIRQREADKKHPGGRVYDVAIRALEINMATTYEQLEKELRRVVACSVFEKETLPVGFTAKIGIDMYRSRVGVEDEEKWQGYKALLLRAGARLSIQYEIKKAAAEEEPAKKKGKGLGGLMEMFKGMKIFGE